MNYILAFLIFSGVIATGNALKCVTCKVIERGTTLNDCDGELEECDENTYKCATQIEQNNVGGDVITAVKKGCFPVDYKDYCEQRFELNAGEEFDISVFSKCCDEKDGCNSCPIQMPAGNTTPNGLKCPVCFAQDTNTCITTEQECVGDQLQCINYSGLAARPGECAKNYIIQGCITEGACMADFGGLPGGQVLSKNFQCTPPPSD
ncbi:phospholipase A2 inhibitor and Ly6/PLAUR domain-containing protein-like [Aquarana catesbeiana]|uniref:phospholipase A2 inhibitor and Ly6/PLAUR domain-containing protein-like n=1 Tax=Aquarana catesbeiana TaxID=8400 RepID=UPI003CC989A7